MIPTRTWRGLVAPVGSVSVGCAVAVMSGSLSDFVETSLFPGAYTDRAVRTRPPADPPLPRGRHAAPREVVWESQRGRLLAAMAEVVASKGYGAVAVRDVIARAGVSRKTFYEHFDNKEECFLAAYDAGVEVDARRDRRRRSAPPRPPARSRSRARGRRATSTRSPRTRRSPGRSSSRSRPPGRPRWSGGRARTSGSPRSSRRRREPRAVRPGRRAGSSARASARSTSSSPTTSWRATPRPSPTSSSRSSRSRPRCSPSAP